MLRPLMAMARDTRIYSRLDEIAEARPDDPRVAEIAEDLAGLLSVEMAELILTHGSEGEWLDEREAVVAAALLLESVVACRLVRQKRRDGAGWPAAFRGVGELVPDPVRRIMGFDLRGMVSLGLFVARRRHGVPPDSVDHRVVCHSAACPVGGRAANPDERGGGAEGADHCAASPGRTGQGTDDPLLRRRPVPGARLRNRQRPSAGHGTWNDAQAGKPALTHKLSSPFHQTG
ncbi:hypothetical protein [Actinomadura sp. 7K507]|uniref:hypothetical protein n=1 Tax=Actinomadura sp. 7K507 TaxID=2530365 RepID=UPI001047D079|nr:hypothetical protein [Actinomadura sp. 7K507]TDC90938.1 hypothetical protein E1285_13995 [Actinomadura sp. 7K507]